MQEVYTLAELEKLPRGVDLYGVVGFPVRHSLSPAFQNAAFRASGIKAEYVRVEVALDQLPEAIAKLKAANFRGWNATLPHKIQLLNLVDEVDESAKKLGAVNTVLHQNGRLKGYNTDGAGWVKAVEEAFGVPLRSLRVMFLGAGGAGRALAIQAAAAGCKRLFLANRTTGKAVELQKELAAYLPAESMSVLSLEERALAEALLQTDLVVNCTALGLKDDDPEILPARLLRWDLLVYDTIYRRTKLIQAAESVGARYANGLGMLLYQGALSWEIWTGRKAPMEIMRRALDAAASEQK
ncbi:MAG: shikimate dehydrogenase [bacterium]